ncbi:glycosyltransferase family 2 protein [Alphaproteobacteria bacterium]|nr:glycosyltransferase family 2 protein [Alphaproteobacteria bacterium]
MKNNTNEKLSKLDFSIIVPMHNESSNAEKLIYEIYDNLSSFYNFDLIIIDDASSDSTFEILSNMKDKFNSLNILKHKKQSGQSAALISGVKYAKSKWVFTLDGDGQNDPKDIKKIFELMLRQAESNIILYAGYRKKRNDNNYKIIQSKIANYVRRKLLNDNTPDTGCGIKLFERSLFLSFPIFRNMHRFLPALAIRSGANIVSVQVNHRERSGGVSHYGMWGRLFAGILDLLGVIWLRYRRLNPEVIEYK